MIWHLQSVGRPSHAVCSTRVRVRLLPFEKFSPIFPQCSKCARWALNRGDGAVAQNKVRGES